MIEFKDQNRHQDCKRYNKRGYVLERVVQALHWYCGIGDDSYGRYENEQTRIQTSIMPGNELDLHGSMTHLSDARQCLSKSFYSGFFKFKLTMLKFDG